MLYIGLVGGTKKFGSNIKQHTFDVAIELIKLGADYKSANLFFDKKRLISLRCQEAILSNLVKQDGIIYAIINNDDRIDASFVNAGYDDFDAAVEMFRNVKNVKIWCVFLEIPGDQYHVSVTTHTIKKYDIELIAKEWSGRGNQNKIHFTIDKTKKDNVLKRIVSEVKGGTKSGKIKKDI